MDVPTVTKRSCLQLAEQATSLQVGISAFGIGGSWNDAFLDTLTAKTGGSSLFISNAKDIRHFLLDKAIGLGDIYANQVTYNFETPANVDLSYAFRIYPDSTPLTNTSPSSLGAVPRKNRLAFLLEFHVNSIPQGASSGHPGRRSALIPDPWRSRIHQPLFNGLDLQRPISPVVDTSPPPIGDRSGHVLPHLIPDARKSPC